MQDCSERWSPCGLPGSSLPLREPLSLFSTLGLRKPEGGEVFEEQLGPLTSALRPRQPWETQVDFQRRIDSPSWKGIYLNSRDFDL